MAVITIKEIAKECNVSPSTVSNVLNGKPKVGKETKDRIMEAIKRTGYQPNIIAQGLRRQKTYTIGLIVEDVSQFTTPGIIEGITSACEEVGYKVIVQNLRLYSRWSNTWFDNAKMVDSVLTPAISELKNIMVDGIVYVAGHARKIQFPEEIDIPVVLAYAYSVDEKIPCVVLDDEKSGYDQIKHITKMGHKNIGIIAGESDNIHTQQRIKGYQKALFEEGILFNPDNIKYAGWKREFGYNSAKELIDKKVTAIVCMNDRLAGGLYQYCFDNGIVIGKDLSLIGFDNEILAEYYAPALTTMSLPLGEIGNESVRQLVDIINNPEDTSYYGKKTEIASKLIERFSVVKL